MTKSFRPWRRPAAGTASRSLRSFSLRSERLEERRLLSVSPVGVETQVNTTTAGNQTIGNGLAGASRSVANDSSGNYIVVWGSQGQDGSGYGIYGQRYTAAGATIGGEFLINSTTAGDQEQPSVAMNASGAFVVTWVGPDANQDGVFARRFNSSGVAQGNDFQVNATTQYNQNDPTVSINATGDFIIAWASGQKPDDGSNGQDGSSYGIYARRFNSTGFETMAERLVNSATDSAQVSPDIALDSSGGFVATWTSFDIATIIPNVTFNPNVYMRRFNSSGTALSSDVQVPNSTNQEQIYPTIAMDGSGNYVISWSTNHTTGGGVNDVFARRYNSSGVAQGNSFQVNTTTADDQQFSEVGMDSAGNFVITWTSTAQDGSQYGVYAQRYNASAVAQESEFRVNTFTTNRQAYSSVALDSTGRFVVVWAGDPNPSKDNAGYGVYSQRYQTNVAPVANAGGPYTVTEGGSVVLSAALSSDPEGQALTYSWDLNGDGIYGEATGVSPTVTWAQLGSVDAPVGNSVFNNKIRVQVSDAYGGVTPSSFATLTVTNAPPTANAGGPYTINEGDSLTLSGSGTDPAGALDPLTYAWDIDNNNVFTDATGASPTLTWAQLVAFGIKDGPNDYSIKVRTSDGDGGVTVSASVLVHVNNTVPTLAITGDAAIVRGAPAPYTFTSTDPSPIDTLSNFIYQVNWGDGSPVQSVTASALKVLTHGYNTPGNYTISATTTDINGGVSVPQTFNVQVSVYLLKPNANNPLLTDLVYGGSSGNDIITVAQGDIPTSEIVVTESLLNGAVVNNVSNVAGITGRVIVYGADGNDTLDGSGLTVTQTTLDGGGGNNTIKGGAAGDILIGGINGAEGKQGNNVIIAGNGDNTIYGNGVVGAEGSSGGNNLIIGGTGNDIIYGNFGSVAKANGSPSTGGEGGQNLIVGNQGADQLYAMEGPNTAAEGGHGSILIAGTTPTLNQAALTSILSEWTSARTYADRVANISGVGVGPRNNGTNYLQITPTQTVANDGVLDMVVGDLTGKENWFFYSSLEDQAPARTKVGDTLTDVP